MEDDFIGVLVQHSPAILEKYRIRVEDYLYMVSSVKNTEIANAIKYHFGWLDQEGNATSSMQGKGIRSSLCMFACESVGGVLDNALQGAAAVELVHNFSLVHDDIQDQDEERRHRPTVWSIWGVSKALQVGNYIRILSDLTVKNNLNQIMDNNLTLRCTETLSEAYLETVEGQYLDLEYEGKLDITTKEYLEMISRKTGALISCALKLGALLGTADQDTVKGMSGVGRILGLVFQIRDDYLGIWGLEENTGKNVANDVRRRKNSLPIIHALQNGTQTAVKEISKIYRQDDIDEDDVERVLSILNDVGTTEYMDKLANSYAYNAVSLLETIKIDKVYRIELQELIAFLLERES